MGTGFVIISSSTTEPLTHPVKPSSIFSNNPTILSKIYEDNINMSVWCRELNHEIRQASKHITEYEPHLRAVIKVTPKNAFTLIEEKINQVKQTAPLIYDISCLVKRFCKLFEIKDAVLKLTVLHESMCPRFHVDSLPCRLITTYKGKATEWLQHEYVNRDKLGTGNLGLPDDKSGLFKSVKDINRLATGDVAIMKGDNWVDNKGRGLVHRSPYIDNGNSRLLVSLDFASNRPRLN